MSKPRRKSEGITGVIDMFRSGDGILRGAAPDGRDVFIERRFARSALPGDRIRVHLYVPRTHSRDEACGKVVEILERARHEIVGTLRRQGRGWLVIPADASYRRPFHVSSPQGGKQGDRVVARFTRWPQGQRDPQGEVQEIIGPLLEPSLDTLALCRQYGFEETFPSTVLREAQSAAGLVDQPGQRMDCRKKLILTIDPKTAKDFDDALSLERDRKGRRVLGVHIADVSHFVKKGGRLDEVARKRGNSVYLPDKTIPMLPEQLSNGVCSLKPDEDRLAFSAFLTLDDAGKIVSQSFAKTRIRSKRRLTYEEALDMLTAKGGGGRIGKLLRDLNQVAQTFRKQRFAKHALDLDIPEAQIILDENGRMTGLRLSENDISHQLVEECMLVANEAVARELDQKKVPFISRIHPAPSTEQIQRLMMDLADLGYQPGDLGQRKNLAKFMRTIKTHALAAHVRISVLRSLNKAVYSPQQEGHFGLAKTHYAHFTSPIRRYPDLVVHRQLAGILSGERKGRYGKERLKAIAIECSKTEQTATEAERAIIETKKLRFLLEEMNAGRSPEYEAVVVKVARFGLFVDLPELMVQGLLHSSVLSSKNVTLGRRGQTLRAGKKEFRVGTQLKVLVARVDLERRKLDFALVEPRKKGKKRT